MPTSHLKPHYFTVSILNTESHCSSHPRYAPPWFVATSMPRKPSCLISPLAHHVQLFLPSYLLLAVIWALKTEGRSLGDTVRADAHPFSQSGRTFLFTRCFYRHCLLVLRAARHLYQGKRHGHQASEPLPQWRRPSAQHCV